MQLVHYPQVCVGACSPVGETEAAEVTDGLKRKPSADFSHFDGIYEKNVTVCARAQVSAAVCGWDSSSRSCVCTCTCLKMCTLLRDIRHVIKQLLYFVNFPADDARWG